MILGRDFAIYSTAPIYSGDLFLERKEREMSDLLSGIILPDHLTTALENRAYREGVLSINDYGLAQIQRPSVGLANADEDMAMDTLCLYDSVVADSGRFNLAPINRLGDAPFIAGKPRVSRSLRLDLWWLGERVKAGADSLPVTRNLLELLTRLGSIDGDQVNLTEADIRWRDIRDAASTEAQVLLRRDLRWYLLDAKRNYEGDEGGLEFDSFTRDDITHEAVSAFLSRNLFWIVEYLDKWQSSGGAHYLEDLDLWDVPAVLRRPLAVFSRSSRFQSYFRFLQDAFASIFESAFLGRMFNVEVAYERAPARIFDPHQPLQAAAAAQIIRVNLADVAEYFPLPRCLEEAVETKSHPRVVAFRQALDRWLAAASRGDPLEARLRRDVEKANRDLRLLKRWKTLKDHPIYFGLKTVGSLIPPVGWAISAIDVVDYFSERWTRSRTAWLVTPRSRLD